MLSCLFYNNMAQGSAKTDKCCGSSVVEHSLGKGEVESSILSRSTIPPASSPLQIFQSPIPSPHTKSPSLFSSNNLPISRQSPSNLNLPGLSSLAHLQTTTSPTGTPQSSHPLNLFSTNAICFAPPFHTLSKHLPIPNHHPQTPSNIHPLKPQPLLIKQLPNPPSHLPQPLLNLAHPLKPPASSPRHTFKQPPPPPAQPNLPPPLNLSPPPTQSACHPSLPRSCQI